MATPDYGQFIASCWGWPVDDVAGYQLLQNASNVVVGTNPSYSASDFTALYPNFGNVINGNPVIPTAVMNAYIALASASIMQARWFEGWQNAMGLFIAHYLTLWLRAQQGGNPNATGAQIASAGLAFGILTSKSADGVSAGYTPVPGLDNWGAWNLTSYGQLFATLAQAQGSGPLFLY